jgi:glycosyltransferase involved in cell wall biosynthesis
MAASTIGVAIATFNGMKFIGQQLESIYQQTVLPKLISISDDCSTDGTREFLEQLRRRSKIPVVVNSNARHLGVIENFMAAFRNCDTDFIAYCDQDDFWHNDKLSTCSAVLERSNVSLVFHRSATVDHNLKPLGSFNPRNIGRGLYTFPHFPDNLWGFGHQMIFSRRVLEVLSKIKEASSPTIAAIGTCFDFSLLVAAGMVGNIYFIDRELMQFRRHSNSVSPAGKSIVNAGMGEYVDSRRNRIQEVSKIIDTIISEVSNNGFAPTQDRGLSAIYIQHLCVLRERYKRRRIVYESESRMQRLRAVFELMASSSYGSVVANKLTGRQLFVDGWRSVVGAPVKHTDGITPRPA